MTDLLTALLLFVTAYYAWITSRILLANKEAVAAMREQSEAMTRPYIQPTLALLPGSPIFVLRVKNTGKTTARNLRLGLDKDFYQLGNKSRNLRALNAFKEPILSFPPGSEFMFWLGTGPEMLGPTHDDNLMPQVLAVTATYEYSDKRVTEATIVDVRPFLDTDIPLDPVTHGMKDITQAIQKVGDGLRKL